MSGSVYGNVVLAKTGDPVARAKVTCGKSSMSNTAPLSSPAMSALTDDAGWYRFDNLAPGEWLLKAYGANGISLRQATVSVFDDSLSEATLEVTNSLRPDLPPPPDLSSAPRRLPLGHVRGWVVDAASGVSLGYATVVVVSGPSPVPDHVFVANSAGQFELDGVPVGSWLLRARSEAGATGGATVHVVANTTSEMTIPVNGLRTPASLTSDRPSPFEPDAHPMMGRLIGHVIYADDGRPVPDATVTILRGAGPAPDIAPMTDRNGRFAFDGLPSGSWLLRAVGPGGETGLVQVSMRPGSTTDAVIKLTDNAHNS